MLESLTKNQRERLFGRLSKVPKCWRLQNSSLSRDSLENTLLVETCVTPRLREMMVLMTGAQQAIAMPEGRVAEPEPPEDTAFGLLRRANAATVPSPVGFLRMVCGDASFGRPPMG